MASFLEWITTKSTSASILHEVANVLNFLFSVFIITVCIFEFRKILSFELKVTLFPSGASMVVYLISTFVALCNIVFYYEVLNYIYIFLVLLYFGISIYRCTQLPTNFTYKKSP